MDASLAPAILAQVAAHLALGKEAGITAGVAAGVPPPLAGALAFAQDTIVFAIAFPLIVLFEHRIARWPPAARFLDRTRAWALSRGPRVRRLGLFGLTLPVWVPWMPLGALGCGVAGLALGFRPRALAAALVGAIAISCTAWASAYAWVLS